MRANYKAWVHTFSQNLIGSKDPTYPDYRDTLLSMGEDISIHISNVVFSIDLRKLLGQVKIPCSILQTWSDITVPMSAAKFLRDHLGGRTNLEILEVKGHLPHLTAPHLVVEKIAQALSTMFLDDFNVHVVGAGQRMLVLGHGMGSDQSVWHRILPFLEPNCRVVLYDLPCAGTVKRRCFDFQRYTTLEDYVDILFKILHALGIDVCVFVGHSVSAMIGILAARRYPTLFSKLILIGASPRFLNDGDYHGGCEQQDVDELFSLMKANWGDWVRLQAPLLVGCDLPEAVEEFYRTLSHYDPSIMMFAFRTILASDLREILGQVRVPCVIMQTNKDASIPRVVAEFLREHLGVGDNLLVMLDTEGHLPQLTAPALLAQKLQEALAWW